MRRYELPVSVLALVLNLFGVVIVGASIPSAVAPGAPDGILVLGFLSVAGWLAQVLLPQSWISARAAVALVTVIAGGLATAPTHGLCVVPVAVTLLQELRLPRQPVWIGLGLALVSMATLPFGALAIGVTEPLSLVSMEAGVVVGALAGLTRRQFALAQERSRELVERTAAAREEHARAAALADRQRAAGDIHDVLAHSLGGLVIQLDAVEALLEAGDTAAASVRVRSARTLAADGLAEARRAVDALREPSAPREVAGDEFAEGLAALAAGECDLGADATFTESGERRPLPEPVATALRRAMQESLSNARKHAPSSPVYARLDWAADAVGLRVENRIRTKTADSGGAERIGTLDLLRHAGGGHGLDGMRERFVALDAGGAVEAGVDGDRFVVRAEARLA